MTGLLRVTILGCGSSGGVPRINGDWGACDPNEPKNARTRCGLLVQRWGADRSEDAATNVLIDASPDLRTQILRTGVRHIDAALLSHDHADQVHGIDDLRAFAIAGGGRIPVYMDADTRRTMLDRFGYCFRPTRFYPPILEDAGELQCFRPLSVDGRGGAIEIVPLAQDHGGRPSLGFRIGPIAYSNDVVSMPEATFEALAGVDAWIVDALRYNPHPTHAHVGLALEWIARVKPRRAVLTDMHIDLDYATLSRELPAGVAPAYDGMRIEAEI